MNEKPLITGEQFSKRLVDLCLRSGLSGLPKSEQDQHILLKSALLALGPAGTFTEQEVNARLMHWVDQVGQIPGLDHGFMRRALVDTGYLTRTKDGSTYQLASAESQAYRFDESINQIDVAELIASAREEMAARKRAFLEKSNQG